MSKNFFSKLGYIIKYEGVFSYLKKKRYIKRLNLDVETVSDKEFIERMYFFKTGKKIDLNNPMTFNEKLQWLKLYWREPLAEICADKFLVRDYIKEKKLGHYLVPLYGVYNSPEEINFTLLPSKFVIKTTHDSGGIYIVRKEKPNYKKIITSLYRDLNKKNQSLLLKEWVYENITPKIIIEKLIETKNNKSPTDYKIYCFHGNAKFILVVSDRGEKTRESFFDLNWNQIHVVNGVLMGKYVERPSELKEMIKIAEVLSKPFPHARVDLYFENDRIYIGELTFFSASGTTNFYPNKYDKIFGTYLDLGTIKDRKYIPKKQKNHQIT